MRLACMAATVTPRLRNVNATVRGLPFNLSQSNVGG
jgi:hypothetical protein